MLEGFENIRIVDLSWERDRIMAFLAKKKMNCAISGGLMRIKLQSKEKEEELEDLLGTNL